MFGVSLYSRKPVTALMQSPRPFPESKRSFPAFFHMRASCHGYLHFSFCTAIVIIRP
ncbi:hypothetical protein LZ30DRAFT_742418, partial [Colletotrichum cereale]